MVRLLLWLWQLPQNLIGIVLVWLLKAEKRVLDTADFGPIVWYCFERKGRFSTFISGAALGFYILLTASHGEETIRHEYGHCRQSLRWGLLYLLTVGIPSAIFCNMWDRWFHKGKDGAWRHEWYYNRYPELGADELGNVNRSWITRRQV